MRRAVLRNESAPNVNIRDVFPQLSCGVIFNNQGLSAMSGSSLHNRSTVAYVTITILGGAAAAVIAAIVLAPFNSRAPNVQQGTSINSGALPTKPVVGQVVGDHAITIPSAKHNAHLEELAAEYDSLVSRLTAAESSIRRRSRDIGDQPLKPQIGNAIEASRSDLAVAHEALARRDIDGAILRMNRVKEALKYLESL
jgi:hypothetical protein